MYVQDKDILIGSCLLTSNNNWSLLTLSKNGAIHCLNRNEEDLGGFTFKGDKLNWVVCRYCLYIFRKIQKVSEHIGRVHIGPAKCTMCGTMKEDMLELRCHRQMCGFPCGVDGCHLKHKTNESAQHHKKQFDKTMHWVFVIWSCISLNFWFLLIWILPAQNLFCSNFPEIWL